MTRKEFEEIADIQYQRAKNLAQIAFHEDTTQERKDKALRLFVIMLLRVKNCIDIAIRINHPKMPEKIVSAGINRKIKYK